MFTFQAKYLPVLDLFAARLDVRYYLNGYNVVPHPKGGVLLRATDGHSACIIHDPEGVCEGDHIIANNADMVRHSKKPRKRNYANVTRWVSWSGKENERIIITSHNGSDRPENISDGAEDYAAPLTDCFIDGTYPDVDRVIPKPADLVDGIRAVVNPDYVARLAKAAALLGCKYHSIKAWSKGEDGCGTLVFRIPGPNTENFLALIMPMRDDYLESHDCGVERFLSTTPPKKKAKRKTTKKAKAA